TKASRRTVPVDQLVLDAVAAHLAERPAGPEELLIRNRHGRPVLRQVFWRSWATAVERVGLPEGTRYHDLRHFYASSLIAAGLHPKVIQVRLGHSTIAETMNTYGHLFPDAEDAGRGALDAVFRAAADVPPMCPPGESW